MNNKLLLHFGLLVYPGIRQILNLQEALDECNSKTDWANLLESTKWKGVECRAYTFGSDLLQGMAVAQQTDAWISLHGSGETNAFFLRPDTIKIQLRPKELGTTHR